MIPGYYWRCTRTSVAAGGDHDGDYQMMSTISVEVTQIQRIFVHLPPRRTVCGLEPDFELQHHDSPIREKNSVNPTSSTGYLVFQQDRPANGLLGCGY
jgi:hypothetical protein